MLLSPSKRLTERRRSEMSKQTTSNKPQFIVGDSDLRHNQGY